MIDDDRLIYQTYENWCFGEDNSGDITQINNILYLKVKALETMKGCINLVSNMNCQLLLISMFFICVYYF